MLDPNRRIQALAEEFITRLTQIAKEELLNVLGGSVATTSAASAGGRRVQKRSGKNLGLLQARLHAYVTKNPGLRIEQINKALGTTTRELQLPVRRLIEEGKLKTKGAKRSTTYSVGRKPR